MVGRIGKPHGIRGEVTVDVRTDEPERRFARGVTLLAQAAKARPGQDSGTPALNVTTLTVTRSRMHQQTLLVTFAEIGDRNTAESARGIVLSAVLTEQDTPEDPEEFYDHQLVGLSVHDTDGTLLGTVTQVIHGSAQDLLAVRTQDGRDALVPFVSALVPEVDVAAGRLVVADRPGLVSPHPED